MMVRGDRVVVWRFNGRRNEQSQGSLLIKLSTQHYGYDYGVFIQIIKRFLTMIAFLT